MRNCNKFISMLKNLLAMLNKYIETKLIIKIVLEKYFACTKNAVMLQLIPGDVILWY